MSGSIGRAIESVVGQQAPGVEYLVLDGGSTDGTVSIIRRYEQCLSYWRSAADGGPTQALIEGIERSKGDVICYVSADDWLAPEALSTIAAAFNTHRHADVISFGAQILKQMPDGTLVPRGTYCTTKDLEFSSFNVVWRRLSCVRIFRKSLIDRFGTFDCRFRLAADFELLLRLYINRVNTAVVPTMVYTYVEHPASATAGTNAKSLALLVSENFAIAQQYLRDRKTPRELALELRRLHATATFSLLARSLFANQPTAALNALVSSTRTDILWPLYVLPGRQRQSLGKSPSQPGCD